MRGDFHCHSYYSDGQHSPAYLLERARENGLTHLAITDHDCITAHREIQSTAELQIISGVEISAAWSNKEIHVVGLGVDIHNGTLLELLGSQQESRKQRAEKIHGKLLQLQIHGLDEYIDSLPCQAVTRSHVADFLVTTGHSKNRQKAFRRYLGKRGRVYVEPRWCSLQQAITAIQSSGGLAVLAHPGRYAIGKHQLNSLLDDFVTAGGEALEASYGNIDPITQKQLGELALARGLYLSQGSDFHDQAAHWSDLGKFPALNARAKKNAIWQHPGWHF